MKIQIKLPLRQPPPPQSPLQEQPPVQPQAEPALPSQAPSPSASPAPIQGQAPLASPAPVPGASPVPVPVASQPEAEPQPEKPKHRLLDLPDFLHGRIIGQDHVIPRVVPTLQNGELGLSDPGRPKGTFLFLGPTGVGKTELTLLMCEFLFGDVVKHCIRLDMSEYQNQESLQLLLGQDETSRGNMGRFYDRAEGRGFILFDEIEKGHPRVLDIFLQVLDAARITVANGETLNLANFYIVATTNIGSDVLMDVKNSSMATIERFIEDLAAAELRPEVLARFNVRCVFQRLNFNAQKQIASIMLKKELKLLKAKGHELTVGKGVLEILVAEGVEPRLGARRMRTTVESHCRHAVREAMLKGGTTSGELVAQNGKLVIQN